MKIALVYHRVRHHLPIQAHPTIRMNKPYSESCDQNREPIYSVIKPILADVGKVLEVGSGTGQHAVYFAEKMPHLRWYTSDRKEYIPGIRQWVTESVLDNVVAPIELDVTASEWPQFDVDVIFTANSVHIMSDQDTVNLIDGAGKLLRPQGNLLVYGPFNYDGGYTSESNQRFDHWLKDRDPESGIKDFEFICELANKNGMSLIKDYEMPANNRLLHYQKIT